MTRRLLALFLVFLLLGMQQEAQRHAVTHFAEWLQGSQPTGLQVPQEELACAECVLLAAAAGVAPAGSTTLPQRALGSIALATAPAFLAPGASASYYSSRAPPRFL